MTLTVILIAAAHAIPIFLVGIQYGKWLARLIAVFMVGIGIYTGNPIYIAMDLLGVMVGLFFTEILISTFSSNSQALDEETKQVTINELDERRNEIERRRNEVEKIYQEIQSKNNTKSLTLAGLADTFAAFITALALLFALSLIGYGIAVLYAKFQQLFNEETSPSLENFPMNRSQKPTHNDASLTVQEINTADPYGRNFRAYMINSKMPSIDLDKKNTGLLSEPEVYWCIEEVTRIKILRNFSITPSRIKEFNHFVDNYNRACGYAEYPENARITANKEIVNWQSSMEKDALVWAVEISSKKISETPQLNIDLIKEIQAFLNFLGFNPGSIDGFYGKKTRQAIQEFQASQNLPITGEATTDLWQSLVLIISQKN